MKQHRHVVYGESITNLNAELTKWVRWAIENPKGGALSAGSTLECFANGVPLVNRPAVDVAVGDQVGIELEFVNSPIHRVQIAQFQFALLAPASFGNVSFPISPPSGLYSLVESFRITGDSVLHVANYDWKLLPGTRKKLPAWFITKTVLKELGHESKDALFDFTLRIFSEGPPADYAFQVKLKWDE